MYHIANLGQFLISFSTEARGDANEGSDWDVIVILDKPSVSFDEKGDLDYTLWTKGLELSEETNTLEYTRSQWKSLPHSLFKINVLNEGIRL